MKIPKNVSSGGGVHEDPHQPMAYMMNTKIGTEVAHVTRTPLSRSKAQGHQAALVGCSSLHVTYLAANSLYALPRVTTCTGGGIVSWPPAQLVTSTVLLSFMCKSFMSLSTASFHS